MMASAAGLGGTHLLEANRELQGLQMSYSVWEFNALLMGIRQQNEADRRLNDRLPILIFANCCGGLVPDSMVPIYDNDPPWTPVADPLGRVNSAANSRASDNTRSSDNFATEACLSAPLAYMQPARGNGGSAPYFVLGPD
jgi:hypothetical protein